MESFYNLNKVFMLTKKRRERKKSFPKYYANNKMYIALMSVRPGGKFLVKMYLILKCNATSYVIYAGKGLLNFPTPTSHVRCEATAANWTVPVLKLLHKLQLWCRIAEKNGGLKKMKECLLYVGFFGQIGPSWTAHFAHKELKMRPNTSSLLL